MSVRVSQIAMAVISSVVLSAACGGSQPPAEPPPPMDPPSEPTDTGAEPVPEEPVAEPEPSEAEPAELPDVPFEQLNDKQKAQYMKQVVVPEMKKHFQAFSTDAFEQVNCVTCHGEGAKEGKFDMPNPELPKLDPKNGFAKHKKDKPEMTKFMMETVVPEMAKLLQVSPYDPKTQKGFGCFDCHAQAK